MSRPRSLPRVMALRRAAAEILAMHPRDAYELARRGRLPGAFKVGKCWFVSTLLMIRGMQNEPVASTTKRSRSRGLHRDDQSSDQADTDALFDDL